ncbi:MAG: DegT/DnrJ/EryC1/StrS family aminotransferase [Oscillospiraceae bacterium]|jgi:dTDP-4-amino-4,6-dideoxygalactose transaminase|nr:DegT/DnrJ/EryC1/StrS family aminotransferase [Oscillospiraceae bacterium]
MDILRSIADEYNILLLEDCSHAHGASYMGKKCGEWGDVAVFSLQGNKIITGGEGGILITNNIDIFEKAIFLGHYNKRCKQQIRTSSELYNYAITGKGLKLRAHPLAVRLAYEQFKNIDQIIMQKQIFANRIMAALNDIPCIEIQKPKSSAQNSWYAMIFRYTGDRLYGVSRELFVEALIAEGAVEADIPNSTCPVVSLEFFKTPEFLFPCIEHRNDVSIDDYPHATDFYNSIFKIPVWFDPFDSNIVDDYISAFHKVCKNMGELSNFERRK